MWCLAHKLIQMQTTRELPVTRLNWNLFYSGNELEKSFAKDDSQKVNPKFTLKILKIVSRILITNYLLG